ncbi:hypothetical protein AWC38_SpisGene11250 [Stylophora pistillata]|uniref:ShKT domain-containing protein n=1 Tax=Stylophora pistillata TaxID=50429 RepID=A0A2B4S420_STYPI|nr:hypothetical protein AWC38_SpisGene11250 [Stylophora pistillata]
MKVYEGVILSKLLATMIHFERPCMAVSLISSKFHGHLSIVGRRNMAPDFIGARGRQVCTQRQLLEFPKMTDFKRTVTVFFLLYLVSSGLGMSLVRRDLKENSGAARFLSALDKRTELFKRSDCQDTNPDVYFCMFAAFEEQSCETYGRECALSCGFC